MKKFLSLLIVGATLSVSAPSFANTDLEAGLNVLKKGCPASWVAERCYEAGMAVLESPNFTFAELIVESCFVAGLQKRSSDCAKVSILASKDASLLPIIEKCQKLRSAGFTYKLEACYANSLEEVR